MRPRFLTFWHKLAIYCGVWLAVIAIACATMWSMMLQHKAAQPETTVDEFLSSSRQYLFYQTLMQTYPNLGNEHESAYEVADDLSREYWEDLTYSKLIREYTYENPVFLVKCGDINLIKLTLEQDAKTGFLGLRGYSIKKSELASETLISPRDYTIICPVNSEIYINNKPYEANGALYSDEFSFGNKEFMILSLENFFMRPDIRVIYNHHELSAAQDAENFLFDHSNPLLKTVKITAPKYAVVSLNGSVLTDAFISGYAASEIDDFGQTVDLVEYGVPTAKGNINVTATLNNSSLQVYSLASGYEVAIPTFDCTVTVPHGASLYANGEKADSGFIYSDNAPWTSDFISLSEFPTAIEYRFEALYTMPEFTAEFNGESLGAIKSGTVISFIPASNEELKSEHATTAENFIKQYLHYTTQGEENTRENLDRLLTLVVPGSVLYKNLEESYRGYTYIDAQQLEIEYIKADNFIPLGENAFTCEISYKIALKNFVGSATEENSFRLAVAKINGTFAAVNMTDID